MIEAGRVRVGQTIVLHDAEDEEIYVTVTKLQWHFRLGVEFFDNGGPYPIVPFKKEIEVIR
jgi:hypothetical protein